MLSKETLSPLQEGKNLLAFSAGVDSSALFFLLLEQNISFDIAIVNYKMRQQADEEVMHAEALAKRYNKQCYVLEKELPHQNFEAEARILRYHFFEQLISKHHYTHLVTAHQLDDRLEWFLMQFTKGAGLYELSGMHTLESRETHTLVRPLLETTKSDLLAYLNKNSRLYFEDKSNFDESYRRNYFRHKVTTPLLEQFEQGITKSLKYLQEDNKILHQESQYHSVNALYYFRTGATRRSDVIVVDKILKQLGFLMRQGDKEKLKVLDEHVVGRRFVVSFYKAHCFIAPYLQVTMQKVFKEQCRKLQVPSKLRGYLSQNREASEVVFTLLQADL